MDKPVKCFVVEGEDRDYRFVDGMVKTFFKGKYEALTITLPAEQNIYMLYEKLKADGFETDLIELLREDSPKIQKALFGIDRQRIDEVFLFFDYDIHQNNLKNETPPLDALYEMISFFNNETENGKLYISYPMVEALYDYVDGSCHPFTDCFYPLEKVDHYKDNSGKNNHEASRHFSRYEDWRMIIALFGLRSQCLFSQPRMDYDFYKKCVSVATIFDIQRKYTEQHNVVFILSAFPEFLLDYFKIDFWRGHVNRHKNNYTICPKEVFPII